MIVCRVPGTVSPKEPFPKGTTFSRSHAPRGNGRGFARTEGLVSVGQDVILSYKYARVNGLMPAGLPAEARSA